MSIRKMFLVFAALALPFALIRAADDHPPKHGTLGKGPVTPKKMPDTTPVTGNKPVVVVSGDSLTINGKALVLPCDQKELVAALGKQDREAKLANVLLTWDELGVFAYVKPNTTRVYAVSIALDRDTPSFWPKKNFPGTLTVDGAPVTADGTLAAINKAKTGKPFEKDPADADSVMIERKITANYLRKGSSGRFAELTVEAKDE